MRGAAGSQGTAVPQLCSSGCPVGGQCREHRVRAQQWSPAMGSGAVRALGEAHTKLCSVPDLLVLVVSADLPQEPAFPALWAQEIVGSSGSLYGTRCSPCSPQTCSQLAELGFAFGSRVCVAAHRLREAVPAGSPATCGGCEVTVPCLGHGSVPSAPELLCVCCDAVTELGGAQQRGGPCVKLSVWLGCRPEVLMEPC